jgi:hypothetical protein
MKRLLTALICLFSLSSISLGQASESFDISTFTAPKGWTRQAGEDAIQFSTEDSSAGAFCLLTLFKAVTSVGRSKENFDAAWQTVVKEAVNVASAPQMQPLVNNDGWEVASGIAPFEKDGLKGAALLVTASGYGKMVNVMILTNSEAFEKDITAFLTSVKFKKLEAPRQPQPAPVNQNGSQPSLVGNGWKKGGIQGGMLGHSGLSTATFSSTYQFFSNGTYKFYRENMQLAAPKYYLENEEGTYTVNGNTITLTSKRAVYNQHRLNKEDPPIKSGNLPLSTVQYRFEFWKYDDIWRLLLSPVDGNETRRDGTFSFYRDGVAQRTYQFQMVDSRGNLVR